MLFNIEEPRELGSLVKMETVRKCFRHVFLMFTSVLSSPKHDLPISWTFREGVILQTRPIHSKYFSGEVREMFLKHALHLSQEFLSATRR